jgi:uncharacterized membrane protein YfcA
MNVLLAVVLSLLIGLTLGLLGGGGSILTVPVLIYALGVEEKSAIASSLLIVSITSAVAMLQHAKNGLVVWRVALAFAVAGAFGAFLGSRVSRLLPATVLLVLLAAVMLFAARAMWKGRKNPNASPATTPLPLVPIFAQGVGLGFMTGLLGAGGGFLIVPALLLLGGLSMPQAVATSLAVISMNAASGFASAIGHTSIDLKLTALVTACAVAGSFVGTRLTHVVEPNKLRRSFAVFVVLMAVFLLIKQGQKLL